jgi:ferredoxin
LSRPLDLLVRIDRSACHGTGSCARRAPGAFSLDRERKAVATEDPTESEDAIRAAAAACPFFAIEVSAPGR